MLKDAKNVRRKIKALENCLRMSKNVLETNGRGVQK